jgi:hypothetical protein
MPKKHEPYELVKKLNFKASQNHNHPSRCVVHIYLNEAATVVISTSSSCKNKLALDVQQHVNIFFFF